MSAPGMEHCPACQHDLCGDPIPEKDLPVFNPFGTLPPYEHTHFSRMIGLSNGDSVYAWKCPDCGHVWERYPGSIEELSKKGWFYQPDGTEGE